MDIAITGATGLIGTPLVEQLRAAGHHVFTVTRSSAGGRDTIMWDPMEGRIDAGSLEGLDAVIHLAGEGIADSRWTDEQKRRILESRTRGTSLIAETLAELDRPPRRLLSGSAIGYYGDTADRPTDERGPAGHDFLAGVCEAWETAAAPAITAGIATTFLRTGIVLSPRGGMLSKLLLPFKLFLGGRVGSGRQWQSWISIDDEVGAIAWLLDQPGLTGAVNLTAPEPVTNAEFTKALGAQLHRPTTITPMIGPRLLYGRELADTLLLTSQRIVPGVLDEAGYPFRHRELGAALDDLLK